MASKSTTTQALGSGGKAPKKNNSGWDNSPIDKSRNLSQATGIDTSYAGNISGNSAAPAPVPASDPYKISSGSAVGAQASVPSLTPAEGTVKMPDPSSYAANTVNVGANNSDVANSGGANLMTGDSVGMINNQNNVNNVGNVAAKMDTSYAGNTNAVQNSNSEDASPSVENTVGTSHTVNIADNETTPDNGRINSMFDGTDTIDTYDEYLAKRGETEWNIYNENTMYNNDAADKAHTANREQLEAITNNANDIANIQLEANNAIHDRTYSYSTQVLADELGINNELAQNAIDAINEQRELGIAFSDNMRDLLLSMSDEMRNKVYEAAELQRKQAYTNADIERERSVVDARSSYEQNKASYGANAEAMARMGLTGSGYSDYVNSQAYAQQRAETQRANAQAATVKREADYTENQAKLGADKDYIQNRYMADSQHAERMYDIDTTYNSNMSDINNQKLTSDYEANSKDRDTKYLADTKKIGDDADVEVTRKNSIANAEVESRANDFAIDQATDAANHDDWLSYAKNMQSNDEKQAAYRQQIKDNEAAEAKEKTSYATAAYTNLLGSANSGAYSADQLRQLAKEHGLSDEQTESLVNAANEYDKKQQAAKNAELSTITGNNVDYIKSSVAGGAISKEQGQAQIENIQNAKCDEFDDEISYSLENPDYYVNTDKIDRAYSNGEISQDQYNYLKDKWNRGIVTSTDFFYADNTMLTKSAAQKALDNLYKNTWCSQEVKNALQSSFDSLYTPKVGGAYYGGDTRNRFGKSNEKFQVTYGGAVYNVQYVGGECYNTNVKEVASDVANDVMFGYMEHVYIKRGGKIYEIKNKKGSHQGSWDALYNALCG